MCRFWKKAGYDYLQDGENKYLIHCRFCKFSHLQRMERSLILYRRYTSTVRDRI